MNKEQITIKKIQELVPEIMRLGIGCELRDGGNNAYCPIVMERKYEKTYSIWGYDGWFNEKFIRINFKIVGRDITLEDLITALNKNNKKFNLKTKGMLVYIEDMENKEILNWLLNTPFHLQSQETKDFIGDLILSE